MPGRGGFRPKVGMVGAGRFGLALSEMMARGGQEVILYTSLPERAEALRRDRRLPSVLPELDRLHDRVTVTQDPQELASKCTLLFVTATTEFFMRVFEPLGHHLDGAHWVIHAVQTLQGRDLKRTSQVIQAYSSVKQLGVIAGPLHVSELLTGKPNAAVVGSPFPAVVRACRKVLAADNIRIYENPDMKGVEFAAALGQVVAMTVGLSDGLGMGAATHATLLTRGLHEIASIGLHFGATERTFAGLAGVGRLVDAVRRGEPNYQLGLDIATSGDPVGTLRAAPPEAQGPSVVQHLCAWAEYHGRELPIAQTMGRVLAGNLAATEAIAQLMKSEQWLDV